MPLDAVSERLSDVAVGAALVVASTLEAEPEVLGDGETAARVDVGSESDV